MCRSIFTSRDSVKRTNSHVIVFDPIAQTVTTEKAKRLKGIFLNITIYCYPYTNSSIDQNAKLQTAPKLGSRVDVFVNSRLIATINLSKLGWATNTKRCFGKCNQILIINLPDATTS
jgi:hypothetical protein